MPEKIQLNEKVLDTKKPYTKNKKDTKKSKAILKDQLLLFVGSILFSSFCKLSSP